MNTMQAHDYNKVKTINMALVNGRYILAQQQRAKPGTIMHRLTLLSLLFLMVFACFG